MITTFFAMNSFCEQSRIACKPCDLKTAAVWLTCALDSVKNPVSIQQRCYTHNFCMIIRNLSKFMMGGLKRNNLGTTYPFGGPNRCPVLPEFWNWSVFYPDYKPPVSCTLMSLTYQPDNVRTIKTLI